MLVTVACSRYIYYGVILHAHPVPGESHNQRNATREVATVPSSRQHKLPFTTSRLQSESGLQIEAKIFA